MELLIATRIMVPSYLTIYMYIYIYKQIPSVTWNIWTKKHIIYLKSQILLFFSEALSMWNKITNKNTCGGKRLPCQLCSDMKNTSTFKSKHSNDVYQIKKNFNCNSKMVVHLIECRICGKQYNGNTVTKFRARANYYKRTQRNFWK